jgi:hypothetical protein
MVLNAAYGLAERPTGTTLAADAQGIWLRRRHLLVFVRLWRLRWSAVHSLEVRHFWYGRALRVGLTQAALAVEPELPKWFDVSLGPQTRWRGVPVNTPAELRDELRQLSSGDKEPPPADRVRVSIGPVVAEPPPVVQPGQSVVFSASSAGVLTMVWAMCALPASLLITSIGGYQTLTAPTQLRDGPPLLFCGLVLLATSVLVLLRRKKYLRTGPVFAADRRGVWYQTNKPDLQYVPWDRISWFAMETSRGSCYLVFGSPDGPLPGAFRMTGWIRVQATYSFWGVANTMPVRAALPLLYELSGGRVQIR